MSKPRAIILSAPGTRGERFFSHALTQVGFDPEVLDVHDIMEYRIDGEQLCSKYKVLIIPGGNSFSSILGGGKVLSIKIQYAFRWDLKKFVEKGGLILGVGTGFQTLLHLNLFGDDYTLKMNDSAMNDERWVKMIPSGNRCVWLKGLGLLELPVNQKETDFIIDPGAYVEARGKLERLGLSCLKSENHEQILGLTDPSGQILGMLPHPEYFLSWTNFEDWYLNPTRAAAPGQGVALFENAARFCEGQQAT